MAIVYRSAGSTLTHAQLDNNFTELNGYSDGTSFTVKNLYPDRMYNNIRSVSLLPPATTFYIHGSGTYNSLWEVTVYANNTVIDIGYGGSLAYGMIGMIRVQSQGYTYSFYHSDGINYVGMSEGFSTITGNSLDPSEQSGTYDFFNFWKIGYAASGTPGDIRMRLSYTGSGG